MIEWILIVLLVHLRIMGMEVMDIFVLIVTMGIIRVGKFVYLVMLVWLGVWIVIMGLLAQYVSNHHSISYNPTTLR